MALPTPRRAAYAAFAVAPAHLLRARNVASTSQSRSPLQHSLAVSPSRPCHVPRARRARTVACAAAPQQQAEPPQGAAPPLPGAPRAWAAELTLDELLGVVRSESSDARVNELARGLLGWVEGADGEWDATDVPASWAEAFPQGPPDFIGSTGDYSMAVDRPIKRAVQRLTKEIWPEHKQLLKEVLGPRGFGGWTVRELTPNRTRRATVVNWVLHYCSARGVDLQ